MTRRRYTTEFKKEAARMIIIDGTPVQEVADQLDVGSQILYRWKQEHLDELEIQTNPGAPSPKARTATISLVTARTGSRNWASPSVAIKSGYRIPPIYALKLDGLIWPQSWTCVVSESLVGVYPTSMTQRLSAMPYSRP